ncbi:unnamed protein product [Linum tenue]|uniref:Uncharacterized protein n=1 Tax=Linum tenue TaxID=586396 RepID=A0AAV0KS62_9ROSI|nr:unnamed protein product [Linum tenue]
MADLHSSYRKNGSKLFIGQAQRFLWRGLWPTIRRCCFSTSRPAFWIQFRCRMLKMF